MARTSNRALARVQTREWAMNFASASIIERAAMNLKNPSHLVFALTMIAIGIMGLSTGGFAPIWAGVPKAIVDRQFLAYGCTIISLVCGAGLLIKRTALVAAFVLSAVFIVWTVLFKVPVIIRNPLVEGSYQSFGENAVLIAGAWMLFASLGKGGRHGALEKLAGRLGQRIACFLYGLALIAFGFSHFAYLNLTAPLVPSWLPGPVFWAYLTGGIYIATGLFIITGLAVRLGAYVAAFQIALITFLVWGPSVLGGRVSAGNWQEPVLSWALTAAAWVVADSLSSHPWLYRFHAKRSDKAAALEGAL